MVRIFKLKVTDTWATYKYYPENESEKYGIVAMNIKTGERKLERLCEGYSKDYASFAFRNIEQFIKAKEYPEKRTIAWY